MKDGAGLTPTRRITMAVIKCSCSNEYQDSKYGKGKRVANSTNKLVGDKVVHRCTVCNKEGTK